MNIYYISGLNGKNLEISDQDNTSSSYLYDGFVAIDGSWIIMRQDITASPVIAYRYATAKNNSGYSSYSNAWANRATLTYSYFFAAQI
jgi:hypothetical protein